MVSLRALLLLLVGIALGALPAAAPAAPNGDPERIAAARAAAPAPPAVAPAARAEAVAVPTAPDAAFGPSLTSRFRVVAKPAPALEPAARADVTDGAPRGGSAADLSGLLFGRPVAPATTFATAASPPAILYAPSDADDPAFRAAIAALTGGTVDYFDANAGTPTAAQLAGYQAVYTYASISYSDRVLFGDRLADYVDGGGKVILSVFCTFTTGWSLGGRIMTAGYSPVTSPAGTNHLSLSAYVGDGTTSLHAGVLAYDNTFRDFLVPQGPGIVDGHYADGEIALAYRPDGRVVYVNGTGAITYAGAGDWAQIIANAASGRPTAPGILYAPSFSDDATYRASIGAYTLGPVNYFDARTGTPSAALLATYDGVYTHSAQVYSDRVLFGDRLADFVDAGNKVVLGVGAMYNDLIGGSDYSIGGRIRGKGYSPVTADPDKFHFALSPYLGDGTTCLHTGVPAYDCAFRDVLYAQGAGLVDGHYDDGEIAQAYRPDGRVVYSNGAGAAAFGGTGDWPRLVANAFTCNPASGPDMLYVVADIDDPAYRRAIAAATGGRVDYFNANAATPSVALLAAYDCVYTHPNNLYNDPTLLGDRLAGYVDAGGKVIMGLASVYPGYALGGRIATPAYSPVTTTAPGLNISPSSYAGDGTTRLHHGVLSYDSVFRETLVLQGAGMADGQHVSGEIAAAYRPDRRVVYLNGTGHVSFSGTGDWALVVANACVAKIDGGALYASTTLGELVTIDRINGWASLLGTLPTFGGAGATEIEADGTTGVAWLQASGGNFFAQPFAIGSGAPLGAPVGNGGAYQGLEFALGRLYGAAATSPGGPSDFRILDPVTGLSTLVGATGVGPISGLAFEPRNSAMIGVTGGGAPSLVRMDITSGLPATITALPRQLGSIEFGPDGDLYGVGNNIDGGGFYRINPTTGFMALVGPTGYPGLTGLTLAPQGTVAVGAGTSNQLAFRAPVPNPSHGQSVMFRFTTPVEGDVRLALYDVAGRQVWEKSLPGLSPGDHSVTWDGRGASGVALGAGVYHAQLSSPAGSRSVRVVRLD
jgi:hypothetical protein